MASKLVVLGISVFALGGVIRSPILAIVGGVVVFWGLSTVEDDDE